MPPTDPKPRVHAAIAIVIRSDGRVLIAQRKQHDTFGGHWEFPGGAREDGESLLECLSRELREELDVCATPTYELPAIEHDYSHGAVRLHPFICRHDSGEARALECQAFKWVRPVELREYRFPPANDALIDQVIRLLADCGTIDFAEGAA
jgi:mutator protein MutT